VGPFSSKGHGPWTLGVTLKLFITIPQRSPRTPREDPSEKLSFYRKEYLKEYKIYS